MIFNGATQVKLPNVRNFGFLITGIRLSDTGTKNISFYGASGSSLAFSFASGYISTDRIISTYNTTDESSISGYLVNGVWNYKVNGVYQQLSGSSFSGLDKLVIDAGTGKINASVTVNSNPINYNVAFPSSYAASGNLTGTITSDIAFPVGTPSFIFYNSNSNLLNNQYTTGFYALSGNKSISFADVDPALIEYANGFFISLPTPFGDIGQKFYPRKTGIAANSILFLADASGNNYNQVSQFDGFWSGNKFTYVDNVLTYNLNFNYSNTSSDGNNYPSTLSIKFEPLGPRQNSGYAAQYITGFTLTKSGGYSVTPMLSGAQYYYVTGLQNTVQSFLFSTGCANTLNVSFSGGSAISGASGQLLLNQIKISGIYNTGIAFFKMATGYNSLNNGYGYQYAPTFSVATGGGCFSYPNLSGVELYQFKKATGYGALYAQAAGLTGLPVMVGTGVSGVSLGNIGMGYSSLLPPTMSFVRLSGDTGTSGASGSFQFKTGANYNFNQFWSASYCQSEGFTPLSGYTGFYYNTLGVNGAGNIQLQLVCSGLDNTSAISGLLTVIISGMNGLSLTGQRVISQSRTFDLSTGALSPATFPMNLTQPLTDLSYNLNQDQYDYQYVGAGGTKQDQIINF